MMVFFPSFFSLFIFVRRDKIIIIIIKLPLLEDLSKPPVISMWTGLTEIRRRKIVLSCHMGEL